MLFNQNYAVSNPQVQTRGFLDWEVNAHSSIISHLKNNILHPHIATESKLSSPRYYVEPQCMIDLKLSEWKCL